jgi:thioredoxin-related protein
MFLGLVLTSLLGMNFGEALEHGKINNKWVFVYFTSNDCPYCVKLKNETFSEHTINKELSQYIYLEINISNDRTIYNLFKQLFSQTNFNQQGLIPSYYMINPHTKKFYRWGYGFKDSNKFIDWLKTNKN